jgi:hypothetical protein
MGDGSSPRLRDQVATGTCVWQWVQDHSSDESTLGEVRQMADERGENWHGCYNDQGSEVVAFSAIDGSSGTEVMELPEGDIPKGNGGKLVKGNVGKLVKGNVGKLVKGNGGKLVKGNGGKLAP